MNMNAMGMNFNDMFGNLDPEMCRLSLDGNIAINAGGEYKVYDAEKGTFTNCKQFVVDAGNMFFVLPTNKVAVGDIILAGGTKRTPKYVLGKTKTTLRVFDYLTGSVQEILPERQMFMGKQYFYGKIVSLFGGNKGIKEGKGLKSMMKFMMLANLMKRQPGNGSENDLGNGGGDMTQTMMMMSMLNGKDNPFDDIKFMMLASLMNGKPGNGGGDMMQTMMMMSVLNSKDNSFDDMLEFELGEDEDDGTETATVDIKKVNE